MDMDNFAWPAAQGKVSHTHTTGSGEIIDEVSERLGGFDPSRFED